LDSTDSSDDEDLEKMINDEILNEKN